MGVSNRPLAKMLLTYVVKRDYHNAHFNIYSVLKTNLKRKYLLKRVIVYKSLIGCNVLKAVRFD